MKTLTSLLALVLLVATTACGEFETQQDTLKEPRTATNTRNVEEDAQVKSSSYAPAAEQVIETFRGSANEVDTTTLYQIGSVSEASSPVAYLADEETNVAPETQLQATNSKPRPRLQTRRLILMAKIADTNNDGKLSEDERKIMRENRRELWQARRKAILEQFDTNHDGVLDTEERQARKAFFVEKRAAFIAAFDNDDDGKLSRDERIAARKSVKQRIESFLSSFDVDASGDLDAEERQAAVAEIKKRMRERFENNQTIDEGQSDESAAINVEVEAE